MEKQLKKRKIYSEEELIKSMSPNTILKYNQIYTDYKKLQRNVERSFPEIVEYVNKKFYYTMIARRWCMNTTYLIYIIVRVERNKKLFDKMLQKAHLKLEEYDY